MEPLNDYVIVKKDITEEKTPSGLVIPGNINKPFIEAWVMAVGPGRPLANGGHEPLGVSVHDKVLAPVAALADYEYRSEKLSIISGGNIVAILYRHKKEGDATEA